MVKIETLGDLNSRLSAWPEVFQYTSMTDSETHEIRPDDSAPTGHKYDEMMAFFIKNGNREIEGFDFNTTGFGIMLWVCFKEED